MRIAAIYDLHGNLPALEAVLSELRRDAVDEIIFGGDIFPGPMARDCLEVLRHFEIPAKFIRGNGDRVVVDLRRGQEPTEVPPPYRDVIRFNAAALTSEDETWVAGWPETMRVNIDGIGDVLFCHATPRNDWEIFTRLTPEESLVPIFDCANTNLVVCGHTHMQFDRRIGAARVVNAGSAGMPFGPPGADWLLLGPSIQLRHTNYDFAAAAERIRKTKYPQAEDFATRSVLQPPSEEAMLKAFTPASLKPRPSY